MKKQIAIIILLSIFIVFCYLVYLFYDPSFWIAVGVIFGMCVVSALMRWAIDTLRE